MVPKEEDKNERYIWGLPDNIQGNVTSSKPTRLQDAIKMANGLMDQKVCAYAVRNVENKRKLENTPRDNHVQQPPFKRQNVARAYTIGNNENHMTRDCKAAVAATTQGVPVVQQITVTCFKCERQGHFKKDCPKSFVSTAFCSLINIALTTLDYSYVVMLADGRVVESSTILRGCTLYLLNHPFNIDIMPVELDGSDERSKSKLSIISCTKTQKYIQKECYVFLAQITEKKAKDKSEEKRLEDVPIIRDFPKVFPEDLLGLPPT
ncbi:putative reverse transcriptase domain-containing protein [Tanacetum coccineum]